MLLSPARELGQTSAKANATLELNGPQRSVETNQFWRRDTRVFRIMRFPVRLIRRLVKPHQCGLRPTRPRSETNRSVPSSGSRLLPAKVQAARRDLPKNCLPCGMLILALAAYKYVYDENYDAIFVSTRAGFKTVAALARVRRIVTRLRFRQMRLQPIWVLKPALVSY
jgi:hypothetical protein